MTTRDCMNPATWTDTDREFLDAAMKLDAEQMDFMIEIMERSNADPAAADFIHANIDNFRLNTIEGRAAFLDALRAI